MTRARVVRRGDRVAVIAPSSPFDVEDLEPGLAEIRRLGFEPVFDERLFARRGYVAGEPSVRAGALLDALADPSVTCVLTARGGFGSVQLLPLIDPEAIVGARRLIVGYSDLTSLLAFVTCRCGLTAAHGPSVVSRLGGGAARYDEASFLQVLTGEAPLGELQGGDLEVFRGGEARGPILGGNLTQLAASLGTPYAFNPPAGSVLLVEDVNERPYRLERAWTQLRLGGVLARAAGIVLADFPGCDEPGGAVTARGVLADLVRGFPGPVVFGLRTGHTPGPALTVPLGVEATLLAGPRPALVIEEAAVGE